LAALAPSSGGRPAGWRLEAVAELLEAAHAAKRASVLADDSASAALLKQVVAHAQALSANEDAAPKVQLLALRILAAASSDEDAVFAAALALLGPQYDPAIQQSALSILVALDPSRAASALVAHWNSFSHTQRAHVVAAFLQRPLMIPSLLEQIKAGAIRADALDAAARQQLLTHADENIRTLASAAFAGAIDADRAAVLHRYASAAALDGKGPHGRELFKKHCASCHRLGDQGHQVGPDLAALTGRTRAALLESLLDPNRTIEERYQSYAAYGLDGRTTTGILVGETATSITLRQQEGKDATLLRSDLDELRDTGVSLMPVGFEKDLSPQDVADVLAYVASQQQAQAGN
jgi:putative heme-binding domain-containing protein